MTLKRAFVTYMESLSLGTFGTDIFLTSAPFNVSPCWWIIATGGTPILTNKTGEKIKQYILSVYYRNEDAEVVDEAMAAFEETINSESCVDLEGFVVIDVSVTTFPADQDLDVEDRSVGLAQVTIQTYL